MRGWIRTTTYSSINAYELYRGKHGQLRVGRRIGKRGRFMVRSRSTALSLLGKRLRGSVVSGRNNFYSKVEINTRINQLQHDRGHPSHSDVAGGVRGMWPAPPPIRLLYYSLILVDPRGISPPPCLRAAEVKSEVQPN